MSSILLILEIHLAKCFKQKHNILQMLKKKISLYQTYIYSLINHLHASDVEERYISFVHSNIIFTK